jgi:AbrB family looped-hinge helix DNA binding protein
LNLLFFARGESFAIDFGSQLSQTVAMITTVDQKGSVPLPKQVLRDSGVQPGDELEVSADGEDIILRKMSHAHQEGLLEILRGLKGLPIPERSHSSVRDVEL